MWLVRDFALQLEVGGRKISPNEYLSNALQPAKVGTENLVCWPVF
jgi:hypothetical protein